MADINHVMVDLETLGTVPGCVGFSIGAVEFFPLKGTLGREFYSTVDVESCLDKFLWEEASTREWWNHPDRANARGALDHAESGTAPKLTDVMQDLNKFLLGIGGMRSLRIYGNGADFDNPILRVMWHMADVDMLGSKAGFFGGRCYRTLKSLDELLGPEFKFDKIERTGTYHNALDDAKNQALHLMANLRRIRSSMDL